MRRVPSLPERHLGLVQAGEHAALDEYLARLAALAQAHIDLDALIALAAPMAASTAPPVPLPPPGQRIALARDVAFSFAYEHLIAGWRRAGAEIVPFSPLADEAPDEAADACWLPGGYPELHGGTLSRATRFLDGVRRFSETRPVHGECGGFMVLGQAIEDADGVSHPMLGLLGHATSFAEAQAQPRLSPRGDARRLAGRPGGDAGCAATNSIMPASHIAATMRRWSS